MASAIVHLALPSLRARPLRTAFLIAAVSLAGAVAVAVAISADTFTSHVRQVVEDLLGRADWRLRHQFQGTLPEDLAAEIARWPEVQAVAPRLSDTLIVVNPTNDAEMPVVAHGVIFESEWVLHPPEMLDGRPASTDREVVIDPAVAERLDLAPGDSIRADQWGRKATLTVSGVHERTGLAVLQQAEIRLALPVMQDLTSSTGLITSADVLVRPSVDAMAALKSRAGEVGPPAELMPAAVFLSGADRQLRGVRVLYFVVFLLVFLGAAFIVLTGLTTAVTETVRDLAVTRCLGASRGQVFASQLLSGLALGFGGGLLGLPLGIGLALLLNHFIADDLRASVSLAPANLVIPLIGSIAAGGVGALLPALAASRVSPLEALRVHASPPRARHLAGLTVAALACVALQQVLLRTPQDAQRAYWLYLGLGVPIMATGWFLMGVPLLRAVSAAAAVPVSAIMRLPRGMLGAAVAATPYRNGFLAGALMLGLSFMISIRSSGEGLLNDWIRRIRFPDAFIVGLSLNEEALETLRRQDWIIHANPIGLFQVDVDRHLFGVKGIAPPRVHFVSFEPEAFFDMTNLEWVQGDQKTAVARLEQGGALLVAREFLVARGLGVGDTIALGPEGNRHTFEIVGVVASPGLDIATDFFGIQGEFHEQAIHSVFGHRRDAEHLFGHRAITMIQMELSDRVNDDEAQRRIFQLLGPVQFGTGRAITSTIEDMAGDLMAAATALSVLALVISAAGMANVMAANVTARRYEYGVLRTIGAPRSLPVRLVMGEAVLIVIAACAAGFGLGLQGAFSDARIYRFMLGVEYTPRPPLGPVAFGCATLAFFALIASLPAILRLMRQPPASMLAAGE